MCWQRFSQTRGGILGRFFLRRQTMKETSGKALTNFFLLIFMLLSLPRIKPF